MDLPFQRHAGRRMDAATHFLAKTLEVGRGGGAGVDQKVAVLLGHLRAATGQAAAAGGLDQFPRLHVGRISERGAAGARAHRLRGFARGTDLRHARGDRLRRASSRAQPGAHDDSPVRQTRMAIGECEIGRGKPALFAGARDDIGPVEARRDVAAIGAAVHHHRAADAAGNTGEEFQSGQSRPRRHVRQWSRRARRRRRSRRRVRHRSHRSRGPDGSRRLAVRRRE